NKTLYTMVKSEVNSVHLFFNISKQTVFVRTKYLIKLLESFPKENNKELSLYTVIAVVPPVLTGHQ
ncbi:MAG TPA: hypothetical protein P5107_11900, partial [Thermotogota bacterium]|nr:hypothetical protein [Thermotogota bacterium]